MTITQIAEGKRRYLPLLLLADEQEDTIDRCLDRGTLYVLDDGGVKALCVVTDEGGGVLLTDMIYLEKSLPCDP